MFIPRRSVPRRRIVAKKAKQRGPGKRYTPAEKAKILAAAAAEKLTGAQVAKRFGVAVLTFYRWRGPVRSDAVGRRTKRGPGRPPGSGKLRVNESAVRKAVQAQIKKVLPRIIREEQACAGNAMQACPKKSAQACRPIPTANIVRPGKKGPARGGGLTHTDE
jgi:transposase-like protein